MKNPITLLLLATCLTNSLSAQVPDGYATFIQTDLYQQIQLWTSWSSWRFWTALISGGVCWLALQIGCATIEEKLQARTGKPRRESFLDISCAVTAVFFAIFWLLKPEAVFSLLSQGTSSSPAPIIQWTLLGLAALIGLNLLYLLVNTLRHYNLAAGIFRLLTVPPVAILLFLIVCLSILALSYLAIGLALLLIIAMLVQALAEGFSSSISNPASTTASSPKNNPPIDPTAQELDRARRGIASSRYPDGKIPTDPF